MGEKEIICIVFYLFCGLVLFLFVWKEIEQDVEGWYDKPRVKRIAIRLFHLIFWPIIFFVILVGLVYRIVKCFWDALTE